MKANNDEASSLQDGLEEISAARRQMGETSLQRFCKIYLGHHFSREGSKMHQEMFLLLEDATAKRRARIAIAAPRGHAKTTVVSLGYLLWSLAYDREKFIVLISNTSDQAKQILSDLKQELETNPLIQQDFPALAEPPERRPSPKRWKETEILTRNQIMVTALGAGQKLRGRKNGANRPTLILLDDVESDSDTRSADTRESRREWFERAVLKSGTTDRTNVIVVGTVLHYDSLLARLIGINRNHPAPGWVGRRYQAVMQWAKNLELWQQWENIYNNRTEHEGRLGKEAALEFFHANKEDLLEGTEVLWPENESYLDLMEMRLTEGASSFDCEKQNEPVDSASCLFKASSLQYWDDTYSSEAELLADLGSDAVFYGACDPSLGKAGKNRDFTAIVTLVEDRRTKCLYVLDADIAKRKPRQIIGAILELRRRRQYRRFTMETNQYQEFLADELKRAARMNCVSLNVYGIRQTQDKLGRVQSLEPLISMGTLKFAKKHTLLLEQLRQFPRGAHDDGPDALEMAVRASRMQVPTMTFI